MLTNLRRTVGTAAVLALGLTGASGAEEGGVSASAGFDVSSAYIWRGITFNDAAVIQPWVDVSGIPLGEKVSLGINVWANMGLADWEVDGDVLAKAGQYNEVDLTLSLSLPRGFSVGYIDYTFPGLAGDGTREVTAGWGGSWIVDPSINVYYDFGAAHDYYASVALGKGVALSEQASVSVEALAGIAGEDFAAVYGGTEGGLYNYNLSASLSYQATEKVGLGAKVGYAGSLNEDALPEQPASFYGAASASFAF